MKRKYVSLLLVVTFLLMLTACNNQTDKVQENTGMTETESTRPTKDRAGNEITVPDTIESIISLAPSITETLVDMGYGDKLIAVDTNSVGLEGVGAELPAFDLMNPDAEQLIALNPDVILVSGMSLIDGQDPYAPMKDMGICVICIPTSDSIQSIKEDIEFLGQVFGDTEKSQEIIDTMQAKIDEISAIGATITEKKTVYFEISAAPYMYSFGNGVYMNEMLELIGAKNIFSDQESWMSVEAESVVSKNPDVILTNVNYVDDPCAEIKSREGFEEITAVKEDQVYYIDNNSSALPNENIVEALVQMAKVIYPDVYK